MVGWSGEGILKRCCYKWAANMTNCPYNDPTLNALWRPTILTHMVFLQSCFLSGLKISGLFDILGFQHEYISVDLMHTGDLGVLLYVYGNVFWELFILMGGVASKPGPVLADLINLIKRSSKAVCQDRPPINNLTIGMLKSPGKNPRLKVKAAESRYFLPVVRHLLEHIFPRNSPHEVLRYNLICKLDDFYKQMRVPESDFDALSTARLCRESMILYHELGREAFESGDAGYTPWKWYPKCHLMGHIELQIISNGSPSKSWCYADESAIGDAVHCAESCHASTLHRTVIQKHRC